MNDTQTFAISAAGMAVERARIEAATLNLANASTIQTPDGATFQPLRVVARAVHTPVAAASFAEQVDGGLAETGLSAIDLPEATLEPANATPRMVYEPGNPYADGKGFVSYPGVDTATEMVTLMSALRAYEANVAAMNVTRTLALKTLDIGGGT